MSLPFAQGPTVHLRRLAREDLDGPYPGWLDDPEVTRYMQTGLFPQSREDVTAFYEATCRSRTEIIFAIVGNDGRHVGNLGVTHIHPVFRSAEIGILLGDRTVWGKGVATEAIGLATRWAFRRLGLHRLHAGMVEANVGCVRAFEKNGFTREGTLREAYFVDGRFVDCALYSLLRPEWEARR